MSIQVHLRQLFVTKNPVLRGQVEDVTRSLCVSFSAAADTPLEGGALLEAAPGGGGGGGEGGGGPGPLAGGEGGGCEENDEGSDGGGGDDDDASAVSAVTSASAASSTAASAAAAGGAKAQGGGGGGGAGSGSGWGAAYAPPKGMAGLGCLQDVPDERFPLFLTGNELLVALDARWRSPHLCPGQKLA